LFNLVARSFVLLESILSLRLCTLFSFQRSIPSFCQEGNKHKKICRQTPILGRLQIYSAFGYLSSKFFINFCSQYKLTCRSLPDLKTPILLSAYLL